MKELNLAKKHYKEIASKQGAQVALMQLATDIGSNGKILIEDNIYPEAEKSIVAHVQDIYVCYKTTFWGSLRGYGDDDQSAIDDLFVRTMKESCLAVGQPVLATAIVTLED